MLKDTDAESVSFVFGKARRNLSLSISPRPGPEMQLNPAEGK
jgi:hypothetical protein